MTRVVFVVLVGALACTSNGLGPGSDADRPDGSTPDADPLRDTGLDGSDLEDGGFVTSEGRPEVCGNMVDDDGDGRIDNGCECAVGTVRPCWLGPLSKRNIGICRDGQQACEPEGAVAVWGFCVDSQLPETEIAANGSDDDCDGMIDESNALCIPTNQDEIGRCADGRDDDCDTAIDCADPDCAEDSACSSGCQPTETLCWGGYDDDCDGLVDCEDDECSTETSCSTPPDTMCPGGQTPIYTARDLGTRAGSSGIEAGDGMPVMPQTCGDSRCGDGLVEVRQGGGSLCVPPPSGCPDGQYPTYRGGTWVCEGPCDVIIQYGYIYGFQRRCAPRPPPDCPSGQVQTFREDTEQWRCDPTCDNTLYDRVWLDGQLVCVPC